MVAIAHRGKYLVPSLSILFPNCCTFILFPFWRVLSTGTTRSLSEDIVVYLFLRAESLAAKGFQSSVVYSVVLFILLYILLLFLVPFWHL